MKDLNRYYKILDLKPGASPEEIKEAFRDLAHVWHPDRFSGNPRRQSKAAEKLKAINEAYTKLRSQAPRAEPRSTTRPRSTQGQKQQSTRGTSPPPKSEPTESGGSGSTSGHRHNSASSGQGATTPPPKQAARAKAGPSTPPPVEIH